jgi:hypothetical protein
VKNLGSKAWCDLIYRVACATLEFNLEKVELALKAEGCNKGVIK